MPACLLEGVILGQKETGSSCLSKDTLVSHFICTAVLIKCIRLADFTMLDFFRQHKIEVTVHTLRNGMIRSECVADSMYASIDLVCHKVISAFVS